MNPEYRLSTLIKLLDDDDIWQQVAKDMIAKGVYIEHELRDICYSNKMDLNEIQTERLEYVLQKINFTKVYHQFEDWLRNTDTSLLAPLLYLTQYIYPTFSVSETKIEDRINDICDDIEVRLQANMTTFQMLSQVTEVLFTIYGMIVNDDPETHNFALNYLLAYKRGHASLYVLLYIYIAQRVGLSVFPVCYGKEIFAGAFNRSTGKFLKKSVKEVLKTPNHSDYYRPLDLLTDPSTGGSRLSKSDLNSILKLYGLQPASKNIYPDTNVRAVYTLLINFKITTDKSEENKAEEVNQLLELTGKYLT
ncbi:MAG: hypothetical protein IPM47_10875 [Sphingobacteriales bacterium]|nr:MAG: hypothetical protein IPM47_10875 [Sphingobacteriales bacterium]